MASTEITSPGEHEDLLFLLRDARKNFGYTIEGIDDEQARRRTTVSELTLGGLVKHLRFGEEMLLAPLLRGERIEVPREFEAYADGYRLTEDESFDEMVAGLRKAAEETDRAIAAVDLDKVSELPHFPWSPPEPEYRTARRSILHFIRETAHHSGHADIIREALDGGNSTARMAREVGFDPTAD